MVKKVGIEFRTIGTSFSDDGVEGMSFELNSNYLEWDEISERLQKLLIEEGLVDPFYLEEHNKHEEVD